MMHPNMQQIKLCSKQLELITGHCFINQVLDSTNNGLKNVLFKTLIVTPVLPQNIDLSKAALKVLKYSGQRGGTPTGTMQVCKTECHKILPAAIHNSIVARGKWGEQKRKKKLIKNVWTMKNTTD